MKAREILLLFLGSFLTLCLILGLLSHFGSSLEGQVKVLASLVGASIVVAGASIIVPSVRKGRREMQLWAEIERNHLPKYWEITSLEILSERGSDCCLSVTARYKPIPKYQESMNYDFSNKSGLANHLNRMEKEIARKEGQDFATLRKWAQRNNKLDELGI